jgi:hypothetical protein
MVIASRNKPQEQISKKKKKSKKKPENHFPVDSGSGMDFFLFFLTLFMEIDG